MTIPMSSSRRSVILFADGPVGEQVTNFVLHFFPETLRAVVVKEANAIYSAVANSGKNIPILIWRKPDTDHFLQTLSDLKADIFFLAWWPFILKRELACGQMTTLNLHPSLLPYGRGKNPNFWAIVRQEPYGVSIHHAVNEIDKGALAYQRQIEYGWQDTGETLYKKSLSEMLSLVVDVYEKILTEDIPAIEQTDLGKLNAKGDMDLKSDLDLDAPTTMREALNLLRARTFPPFRGCQFTEAGKTYNVRVDIEPVEGNDYVNKIDLIYEIYHRIPD